MLKLKVKLDVASVFVKILFAIVLFATVYPVQAHADSLPAKLKIEQPTTSVLSGEVKIGGWALTASGVDRIEVYLNGQKKGQAAVGLSRGDVARSYPNYPDAKKSGYQYVLDSRGISNGYHTLKLKVYGKKGEVITGERKIRISNPVPRGKIEKPLADSSVSGTIDISGWALTSSGVKKVEVYLGTTKVGQADYGGTRGDVAKVYPTYVNARYSGFKYRLDTTKVLDGSRVLKVKITGNAGEVFEIQRKFTIKSIVRTTSALYTYEEMLEDIKEFEKTYPGKVTRFSIGKSVLGKDLAGVLLGNPNASKKLLIQGSAHGREYMTTQLIMKQIEFYLRKYDGSSYNGLKFNGILDDVAIYFVPMLNPDGVTLSQKGVSFITDSALKAKLLSMKGGSKNFSRWKANINGVDLNRNFNANWAKVDNAEGPGPSNYKGPYVESEPESKALADFARAMNFDGEISYHAMGSIIFWYYFQEGEAYSRDKKIVDNLAKLTGYGPVKPAKNISSHGGFTDWFILEFGKPGFTIEIGKVTTPLPISAFPGIWKSNRFSTMHLAHELLSL